MDSDSANLAHASVQITGNYVTGQDVLGFVNTAAITGSFNAVSGFLTLTGTDTVAHYQAALRSVTYVNTSDNPSTADRTLTIVANDGIADSAPATATLRVAAINDAPSVTAGATLSYVENQLATAIDTTLTLSDVDNTTLAGATVQITSGYASGQDVLGFANTATIGAAFNAATGTLTLTGNDTLADYRAALRAVTYVNTSDDPSAANRTISFTVSDGAASSAAATSTVTPVNDAPTLAATGATATYVENGAATNLFSGVSVSTVESGQSLDQLVLTVSNVSGTTDDRLTIDGATVALTNGNAPTTGTPGTNASVTVTSGTATVTVSKTGGLTAAAMAALIDGLAYANASENPAAVTHAVTITSLHDTGGVANGGQDTATPSLSASVLVQAVNDAPVNGVPGTQTFNEDTPLTFSAANGNAISISDVDAGANLMRVELFASAGTLTLNGTSGLTILDGDGDNAVTIRGSIANANAVLNGLIFTPRSDVTGNAGITIYTIDSGSTGSGGNLTDFDRVDLVILPVNDAPVNSVPASIQVQSGLAQAITGLSISDVDAGSGTLTTTFASSGGTVAIGNGTSGGTAGVTNGATVTTNGSGSVTLTGTLDQINTSIGGSNVTFTATDGAASPTATSLTVTTNDGGNTGTGGAHTDVGSIAVGVLPQVWFINGDQTGANGSAVRGSQANPFSSISEFNTASTTATGPGVGDYIYLKAGTYTGDGINLKDGQTLLGDDQALSFTDPLNPTGPAIVVESASGARPTINVTSLFDQGIDLASGNTIRGITIQTTNGTTGLDDGSGATAGSVGNLTITGVSISGGGQAVDIDHGGNLNVTLDSVSSTAGSFGIKLAGLNVTSGAGLLSATFNGGTGALSGASIAGFLVGDGSGTANTGGTATASYAGTVATTGGGITIRIEDRQAGAGNITLSGTFSHASGNGSAVYLHDVAAGTTTFSGANSVANSGSSSAINLFGNTGATINFSGGGLDIDATTGSGFSAASSGTVTLQGSGNSIATTTGTALNVANTTIGASGLTFRSISSSGAASGIVLNNTGTSGGLTVTGDGGATSNGSGGTIQNSTDDGVNLTNTENVRLGYMNITNNLGNGIGGSAVNGLVLNHVVISENGNDAATDESGINIVGLTGSAANGSRPTSISSSTISNNNEFEVQISNSSGTLSNFQLSNNTISANGLAINGNATSPHGNLVNVLATGTAVMNLTATGGTYTGNTVSDATHVITGTGIFANSGGPIMNVSVSGATFTNNNVGVDASTNNAATTLTFTIDNNVITGSRSTAINHFDNGNALYNRTVSGTITNNTIGTAGVSQSGSTVGNGISIQNEGAVNGKYLIDHNTIQQVGVSGGGGGGPGISVNVGLGGLATAGGETDVTITNNTLDHIDGSRAISTQFNQNTAPFATLFANISGNSLSNIAGQAGNGSLPRLGVVVGNTFKLTQAQATAGNTVTELDNANGFNDPTKVSVGGGGTVTYNAGTPPQPLLALPGDVKPASGGGNETHLTQAQLDGVVAAAIGRWAEAGLSAEKLDILQGVTFDVANLAGSEIGSSAPGRIKLDADAAGHGWFLDATPRDDAEFGHAGSATRLDSVAQASAEHIDLLTAVMHEMGHQIGLSDSYATADRDGLMYGTLSEGERRLPDPANIVQADQVSIAQAAVAAEAALPAGAVALPGTLIVPGTTGNDVFHVSQSNVILAGGAGADTFVFDQAYLASLASAPATHIADYSAAKGDVIDVTGIVASFAAQISGFELRVAEDASGGIARLQAGHAAPDGGERWVDIVQLDGVHAGDGVAVVAADQAATPAVLYAAWWV